MNFKSPFMIVLYCLAVITIVSFCLINVVSEFSIVGSIGLIIIFLMCTYKTYINYLVYKRQKHDQRISDAYLYAEEIGNEEAIKTFAYDKKTERQLRAEKFSKGIIPLSFLTLTAISVILLIVCIRII